jgi:hypothetical protein
MARGRGARYLARGLAARNPHHPHIVLWGAGRVTRRRARLLVAEEVDIASYIDIDPRKIGHAIEGRAVVGPGALPAPGTCFVVVTVASVNARDQIERVLTDAGHRPGFDYILAG